MNRGSRSMFLNVISGELKSSVGAFIVPELRLEQVFRIRMKRDIPRIVPAGFAIGRNFFQDNIAGESRVMDYS